MHEAKKTIRCPTCGHEHADPDYMEGLELKTIRGRIGIRKGWQGPLPAARFARLLRVSPRSLANYELGTSRIPRLVAHEARRLAKLEPDQLKTPRSWEAARETVARRRMAGVRRAAKKATAGENANKPRGRPRNTDPPAGTVKT